ncbi:hypothetical protein Dform_01131 [Dehalogenimonas formicexedens]|uniref:PIN domain-containing protein n=1 Tax=Dehalogenimonas formicexedens TaxID=1839801 RepID=A0A1P8F7Q2_9CHLR|nr:hypothetical protein [Dehalogenimonas formicexedens]APV44465.1 hypothetical protein Dform_01131 [Dehalogenimonas formicexedens]
MDRLSSFQVPPPANWQDFESLCCDLWRAIWKDPDTQKNGRQGQPQHGVDIFGRPNQGTSWAGVQCKGKDNYAEKSLTEEEVESEVEKAKSFKPSLKSFAIATSGKRDAKIQQLGRNITDKHLLQGLFPFRVWSWDDILEKLDEYPDIVEKYYSGFCPESPLREAINEVKEDLQRVLEDTGEIKSKAFTQPKTELISGISYVDISSAILVPEYQAEIDHSRALLKAFGAVEAISYLSTLKDRIWANSPPIVKYRILTNIGSAKGMLNERQESARLLIEALQYNPTDEKALTNAALGQILLDSPEQALPLLQRALELNPSNTIAHSLLIQCAPDAEHPEETLKRVPEPLRKVSEIANAIGYLFYKKGDIWESKKWIEIAVNNDSSDSPDLKAGLGTIIIKTILDDQVSFSGVQVNESKRVEIQRAIQLLTSAWDKVATTSIRHCRTDWLVNRGLGKAQIGDIDGAIADVKLAIEIVPSDNSCKKVLAMLLHENNENRKAITLLKELVGTDELPEASLLLGIILRGEGEIAQAVDVINKLIARDSDEVTKEEGYRLLLRLYIDQRDVKNAGEVSSILLAQNPSKIAYLVDSAAIESASNKKGDAISILMNAKGRINAATPPAQILEVADGLYEIQEFEEAVLLYERVVDTSLNTPLSRRLLNAYYRAGMLGKALNICQTLHRKFGVTEYTAEMESAIYEEIGDLPNAKAICEEYLEKFPANSIVQLRLAVTYLRSNDFEKLDKYLDSEFNLKTVTLEHGLQYAALLAARNRGYHALSVSYELRRTFFNAPMAHQKYMGMFLQREKDEGDWLKISVVGVDTAVCIEEDGHKKWYLIVDREDADANRSELNLNHQLIKNMLGKSVGDSVILVDSPYSKIFGKIIEIKSKYVYAFQESLASFETWFPDATGVWKVKIDTPQKDEATPEGFQAVLDSIGQQHERGLLVEKLYKAGQVTIGAFANLAGRNTLEVWNRLTSNPEPGIIASVGSYEELSLANSAITPEMKLIADVVSIMTIHAIGAADFIVTRFGKIGLAQSTVDLLSEVINERKGIQAKGFLVIGKEGDKFISQDISAEDIKRNLEYLEGIVKWIGERCEIIPCKAALTVKREKRRQFAKLIGASSTETLLIASESGSVLFTDDERLRSLGRIEYKTLGVWTQALLIKCLTDGTLDRNRYNDYVIQLASLNYRNLSIDAHILIEAAKRSGWTPKTPFTSVLKMLGGAYSEENSALIVGTTFIYGLFKQAMLTHQRDQLILSLLDTLTSTRKPGVIIPRLKKNLDRQFTLIPLALPQVFKVIDAWQRMHIT